MIQLSIDLAHFGLGFEGALVKEERLHRQGIALMFHFTFFHLTVIFDTGPLKD